jgi:F420H(2)-dependent quinone reductase
MRIPNIRPRNSFGHRVVTRIASTALGITIIRIVGTRIDPTLIRLSGGRLSSVAPFPALLLSHTGARTGVTRTTPIVYFTDAGRVIVIASNFGGTQEPRLVLQHQGEPQGHPVRPWLQRVFPRRGSGRSRTRPVVPIRGGCIVAIRPLPAVGASATDRRDRVPTDRVTAACCRLAGLARSLFGSLPNPLL